MKKLKEKLNAKLSKNGGFTLVEMLIVVAIIAILVVVSVPIIGSSLENAKKAADDANMRSASGIAMVHYLSSNEDFSSEKTLYYVIDATSKKGSLETDKSKIGTGYGQSSENKGEYIVVTIQDPVTDGDEPKIECDWKSKTEIGT